MPESFDLKITPLSVLMFKKSFDVPLDDDDLLYAYAAYLKTNAHQHHYNGLDINKWYKNECEYYRQGASHD